ncbi:MAG: hypothetical protein JWP87_3752 [Labilithrix sp.]|nr:hypothetical protein [Labilithrix sp.]
MNRSIVSICSIVAGAALVAACSSTTDTGTGAGGATPGATSGGTASDPGASTQSAQCGSAGRTGKSACYTIPDACSAGQYCANGNGNGCEVGCTSDENCSATEHCVRCGTNSVGTCRSCGDKNDGCTVTPPPKSDAAPTDPCERNTAIDFMCEGTLPKAYECFGQEPLQTGCKHGTGDPTVFCCAK